MRERMIKLRLEIPVSGYASVTETVCMVRDALAALGDVPVNYAKGTLPDPETRRDMTAHMGRLAVKQTLRR